MLHLWEANDHGVACMMHSNDTKSEDNGEDRFNGVRQEWLSRALQFEGEALLGQEQAFQVGGSKPVTVTTQFITSDGIDDE